MHTFVLQDWTTIRGATTTTVITQGESTWLDLTAYQDVVFWVDTRELTGTVTMSLQTSPTKDDVYFQPLMTAFALSLSTSSPTVKPALMASASTPLARYVRWQLTGPAAVWDATFRIIAAANSPGM